MKKYLIFLMVVAFCSTACRIKKAGLPKPNNLSAPVQLVK
jgi:hypothetical protein